MFLVNKWANRTASNMGAYQHRLNLSLLSDHKDECRAKQDRTPNLRDCRLHKIISPTPHRFDPRVAVTRYDDIVANSIIV